ncbi:MAG: hypothetical protein HY887_05775 [Deltaproteobacteria bacterium]|nr:hypothetical protein [Deltaproteobacteria bacterium]
MKALKAILILAAFFLLAPCAGADGIAVIVNNTGPLSGLTESDIKDIYLGNLRFVEGVKITPLHYKEGPVKDAFLKSMVGKDSFKYRQYWTKKTFQDGTPSPATKTSPADITSVVIGNRGAIAYLPESELGDLRGVRVITKLSGKQQAP